MTREEILQTFSDINYAYNNSTKYDTLKRMLDELTEPCEDATLKDIFCMGCEYKEQEPTAKENLVVEDAISRQAVLDMVEDMTDQFGNKHRVITEGMISLLPPVTPKPKTGHWIWDYGYATCDQCGYTRDSKDNEGQDIPDNYCPNCGAKMTESEET